MRRFITFLFLIFTISLTVLAQRMSDEQVVQYVQQAQMQGKTQAQMLTELMKRGVTREQLERLRDKYAAAAAGDNNNGSQTNFQDQSRLRQPVDSKSNRRKSANDLNNTDLINPFQLSQRENRFAYTPEDSLASEYSLFPSELEYNEKNKKIIFGQNIFSNEQLSFEPNANLATPVNYKLGPGDEVIIDIWGNNELSVRQEISPEGNIQVEKLGLLYLSGMTINEANEYIKREFSKVYSSLQNNSSEIKLTLGQNRSIQVNIMGEVTAPGTYILSSFATVFHALYNAGGINEIGGLRKVDVIRGGRKIAEVDIYEYIIKGNTSNDIRLMEDDVILVHPYDMLVNITGSVKRPMFYEMKKGESISALLNFAGGFTGNAYKKNIRVFRSNDREKQIFNVDEMDFSVFQLADADSLDVGVVLDRFENRVEVIGAVYREGMYQINGQVSSVKQLVQKAEGIRGDAFLDRVILRREKEDLTLEIIQIDLKGILNGTVPDIVLQRNDLLYIPSIHDLKEEEYITIHGEVSMPGTYIYAENMTVEDLIVQAGGLLEAASMARIDVARRIKNPHGVDPVSVIGDNYSLEIKNGLIIGDRKGFNLEPFDEIYVRRSPAYHVQQNVTIEGEVVFNGNYALSQKNERLSDLVTKAGGLTNQAYVKGARLIRKNTPEEMRRKADALRIARQAADSSSVRSLDLSDSYPVGINLDAALQNPGSDFDLVLREGDKLIIPEYINTVKINGAVMYPNTVLYRPGEGFKYYLDQAGGYGNFAKKRKAYVIYLNGTVARLKGNTSKLIEPGCEIIVPAKKEDERRKLSPGEVVSMGTSVASLAAMIATLVQLFK